MFKVCSYQNENSVWKIFNQFIKLLLFNAIWKYLKDSEESQFKFYSHNDCMQCWTVILVWFNKIFKNWVKKIFEELNPFSIVQELFFAIHTLADIYRAIFSSKFDAVKQ